MALGARSQQVVWSINRRVAGLIGVATSIGLVLTVLIVLALRATPGSADIGIGSMDVYRPNIDPVALVAIAAVTAVVGVAAAFVPARRAVRMIHLCPCATSDATLPRVVNDIRLALRRLGATPLFTVFAILCSRSAARSRRRGIPSSTRSLCAASASESPVGSPSSQRPTADGCSQARCRRRTSTICERRRHRSPTWPRRRRSFGAWLCLPRHRC